MLYLHHKFSFILDIKCILLSYNIDYLKGNIKKPFSYLKRLIVTKLFKIKFHQISIIESNYFMYPGLQACALRRRSHLLTNPPSSLFGSMGTPAPHEGSLSHRALVWYLSPLRVVHGWTAGP